VDAHATPSKTAAIAPVENPHGVTVAAALDWAWMRAVISAAGGGEPVPASVASPQPIPVRVDVGQAPPAPAEIAARSPQGPVAPARVPGPAPATVAAYTLGDDDRDTGEKGLPAPSPTLTTSAPDVDGSPRPRGRTTSTLPDRLELARLLRRLRHTGPSPHSVVVDEEATAEHAAMTGLVVPHLEPARERWYELALVVDNAPSVVPWQRMLDEFTRQITRHGAFRAVRTWTLDTTTGERARLRTPFGTLCPDNEPAGPGDRRIVMVISDGVGSAWSHPDTERMIARWARLCPVLFVQLLPRRWWDRARVRATPVVFRGGEAGPGRRQAFRLRRSPTWVRPHDRVAIPMIGLHPDGLRAGQRVDERAGRWSELSRWTRMLTDTRGREFPHAAWVLDGRTERPAVVARVGRTRPEPDPEEHRLLLRRRLAEFRASASPAAVELLDKLAAAPISVATMRAVQTGLLADDDPAFAAEVFLSGLLVAPPGEPRPGLCPDDVEYDFGGDVREVLLAGMSRSAALDVYFHVEEYVRGRSGGVDFDLRRLITSPVPVPIGLLGPESRRLARVGAGLLRQLGPGYGGTARRLGERAAGPALHRRRALVRRWDWAAGDRLRAAPLIRDGVVVVLDASGELTALDQEAGTLTWSHLVPHPPRHAPVGTPGEVWVGASDGLAHGFATRGGALGPPVRIGRGAVVAMIAPDPHNVFAATLDGRVGNPRALDTHRPDIGSRSPVGLAAAPGRVAMVERSGVVAAWETMPSVRGTDGHTDLLFGAVTWQAPSVGAVHCAPAADDTRLYVPLALHGVRALDWESGENVWSTALDGGVLTPPAAAGDRVIVASADGGLYALDAATGRVLWSVHDDPQPETRVNVVGPLAYVAGGGGGLRVFDTHTGRRLAEIRSTVVVFVAVDPAGHLVLAGLDGSVTSLESPVTVG